MTAIGPYAWLSKNVVGGMPLLSVDQAARRNAGVARYPIEVVRSSSTRRSKLAGFLKAESLDRPKEKGPPRWGFCGDPLRGECRVICEIRLLSRRLADESASGGKSGFAFDGLN